MELGSRVLSRHRHITLAVDESEPLHVAPVGRLAELHPLLLEPLASLVHVGHRDPDVSEASRVLVARVVLEIGIVLGAPVVGKLHGTGLAGRWAGGHERGTFRSVSARRGSNSTLGCRFESYFSRLTM